MNKTIDELKKNGTYKEKLEYVSVRYDEVNEEIARLCEITREINILAEKLPFNDAGLKAAEKLANLSEKISNRATALTEEMISLITDLGLI